MRPSPIDRTRTSLLRPSAACLLLVVGLLLSGCVYLRLLEFKRQLGDFDRHFTLSTDDGLRLICQHPIVLSEDFRWLGFTPESVKALGQAEQWRIRWTKQLPPGVADSAGHDIEMELMFAEGRFTRLHIPERFFAFVPKPFFTGLLRSLGQANVDRSRRLADVSFTPAERSRLTASVTPAALAALLGRPSEQTVAGDRSTLRYRYTPVPPESKNGIVDMFFTFEAATGQLLRLHGRSPVGQVSFNFETAQPTAVTSSTL
jgi:hypothetical protein